MICLTSPLQAAGYSLGFIMGNVLKKLCLTFSDDPCFLIHGGIASIGTAPISVFIHIKSSCLNLWRSCHTACWPRTILQSTLIIFAHLQSLTSQLRGLGHTEPLYTHMTPEAEKIYWKKAAASQRHLQRSDARYVDMEGLPLRDGMPRLPPLVMYYTPALLPKRRRNPKKPKRYFLSAKDYCKWHKMVFPDNNHPTLAEASRLRKMHDPEELQEIHRISRMLPDDEIFPRPNAQPKPWTPKYQRKWLKWRASHREALERL